MIRNLEIPSEYVERIDTSQVERILGELEKDPTHVRKLQNSLTITFPDYESQGITYLLPQVKEFWLKLYKQVPHLLYYLWSEPELGYLHIFLCVNSQEKDLVISQDNVQIKFTEELLYLLFDQLMATAEFSERMADDTWRIVKDILRPLPEQLSDSILADLMAAIGRGD
jgi:hypothetical protein